MTTTPTVDEMNDSLDCSPGARLAAIRLEQGYSAEYVAGKLHLRVRIIELLEADEYTLLPEPVFVKGYLRAYAKLLGVPSDPLLDLFQHLYKPDRVPEKTLWQGRREKNRAEHAIRWLTGSFAVIVVIAVATWWYTNKDNQRFFSVSVSHKDAANTKTETEIRLTDLSKMRSILSSPSQLDGLEKDSG